MSIIDKIKKTTTEIKEQIETHGKADYGNPLVQGLETFYGTSATPKLKASEYLKSAMGWVYGCVMVIADEVGMIDLRMVKYSNGEEVEVDDHVALDVLYKANNAMSRFDLIQLTFQYLELTGEAPWFISFKGNVPDSIILLRPDRLTVLPGKDGELIGGYKYKIYGDTGVQEITLEPYEVVPLKYIDPNNPVRGKGPLQAAAITYDLDNYAEKWNSQFFRNSASPSAALSTDKVLAKDVRSRLEKKIKENYGGVDNAHKTMILESGLKWQSMNLSQKDMDFIEQQKFSRDKILSIFRVPPTALGLTADVTRANAEATDYVFAKRTIDPKMRRFIEQLNEFYLPLFTGTDALFFDYKSPVPQNTELLINQANSGVQNGYITINEARQMFGMDPIDGGDELRAPIATQPVANSAGGFLTSGKKKNNLAKRYTKHLFKARTRKGDKQQKSKEILKNIVQESVTSIVFNYLKSKSSKKKIIYTMEKSVLANGTHDEAKKQKYIFQEKQLHVADEFEKKMIAKLNSVFNIQKDIILHYLDSGEKIQLNVDLETQKYKAALKIVFYQLMKEQADLAFQLLGIQKDFKNQNTKVFTQTLSDYFDSRIFKIAPEITRETNAKLQAAFKEAADKEESIPQIKSRVTDLFNDMQGYRSERIARTETIRGSNFATEQAYIESGVVEAKEWLTTKDERTDDECLSMDGKVIPLGNNYFNKGDTFEGLDFDYEAINFPPLHVNCRCTLIPVIGTPLQEGQWRPSMNSEQADKFIENSKLKTTLYHGTTEKAADKIKKDGFLLSQQNIGEGVYLTNEKKVAADYASVAGSATDNTKGTVLQLKVNATNYKRFKNTESFVKAIEGKFGDLTNAKATQFLKQFDAVKIDDTGYYIITNPKNIVVVTDKI